MFKCCFIVIDGNVWSQLSVTGYGCMEVSLVAAFMSQLLSGLELEDCWELLLGSLDLQDAGGVRHCL